MSIYRSTNGRDAISAFAVDALDGWDVAHAREHQRSALGPTHVVTAGDGRPLVLLAGTNFCAATWLDLIGMLAATHRVHAVDLPGQPGLSHGERPRRPRDVYGRWLADLMPRVTDAPAVLVGHYVGCAGRAGGRRRRRSSRGDAVDRPGGTHPAASHAAGDGADRSVASPAGCRQL